MISDQSENRVAAGEVSALEYGHLPTAQALDNQSQLQPHLQSYPREPTVQNYLHDLTETIEHIIIPQLQVNLGVSGLPAHEWTTNEPEFGPETVETFARLVISHDNREAFRFVESLLERNIALETILLDLMAPAARHMNHLWVTDTCSFVDVTLGMTRIQQILRQSKQFARHFVDKIQSKGQLLLVPVPGEQHTFGLRIIEELLVRDGWDVTSNLRARVDDIIQMVSLKAYDVIGLSMSRERLLEPLQSVITFIRHHSINRSVRIIVGGVAFDDTPELAKRIDADAVVTDVRHLLATANALSSTVQFAS